MSDEPLFGPAPKQMSSLENTSTTAIIETRKSILKKMKSGLLAYSETPVDVCTPSAPCDKRLHGSVAACISCPSAVIKKTNLLKVIDRKKFVSQCNRNEIDDFEYRY